MKTLLNIVYRPEYPEICLVDFFLPLRSLFTCMAVVWKPEAGTAPSCTISRNDMGSPSLRWSIGCIPTRTIPTL